MDEVHSVDITSLWDGSGWGGRSTGSGRSDVPLMASSRDRTVHRLRMKSILMLVRQMIESDMMTLQSLANLSGGWNKDVRSRSRILPRGIINAKSHRAGEGE